MPSCILAEWQSIWNADINWAYTDTFEYYSERSMNPEDAEVDIYIALK
jgi:predicted transcriptional regulator YdeE